MTTSLSPMPASDIDSSDLSSLWASEPSLELLNRALSAAPLTSPTLSLDSSLEGLDQAPALVTPLAEVRPEVRPCRLRRDLGAEPPSVSPELWAFGYEVGRIAKSSFEP